ncbi:MAG TPA: Maf family protein [Pyrinomonadaceae bacterium]|nr:Maf family protein [Pyrinomonadaceae bacterium]
MENGSNPDDSQSALLQAGSLQYVQSTIQYSEQQTISLANKQLERQAVTSIKAPATITEPLLLASTSPRRAEILRAAGWSFEIVPGSVDETRHADEDAITYVRRLAEAKCKAAADKLTTGLVLGADTTVVVHEEILGQPADDDDARRMLRLLRGGWHEVITGVALVRAGGRSDYVVDHESTRVRFSEMSDEEIEWYVATGETKGKAGAYGIQGAAALFIEEIAGDYLNIVGLPLRLVYNLSKRM